MVRTPRRRRGDGLRSYPGQYRIGYTINGLGDEAGDPDSIVFHAGAQPAENDSGDVVTAGGRVLAAVGLADSVADARERAYRRVQSISFTDAYYRRDIAAMPAVEPVSA